MKISRSETYDSHAMTFQALLSRTLDEKLKDHDISKEKRRAINESFQHEMGMIVDQGWFESDGGQKVYPIIVYSAKHWEQGPEELIYNSGFHSYCDFSISCVMDLYDGEDWIFDFKNGWVGDE